MSAESPSASSVSLLRRVIVWVIVVSFGLAALGGIVVLLGGELGETGSKVIATTAIVGAFSAAILCCASLIGKHLQPFGLAGVVIALATLGLSLWLVWTTSFMDVPSTIWRILGTGIYMTAAFSLASLLLLLADRTNPAVRWGLSITLLLFAIVLVLSIYVTWAEDYDNQLFQRIWGVFGILAALGAIVVAVMSLLLRDPRPPARGYDEYLMQRLTAEAARRGITVEQLVAPLLAPDPPPGPGDHPA